ncbi:alpha/beta hydrolase [Burkholderia pyrrocinia]|uniref:alpha/beta fold hydrolase n=1 Tax=Burkholderia pyrrocinia TaxID=60550 RepID=UPI0030D07FC4
MSNLLTRFACAAAVAATGISSLSAAAANAEVKSVVLVHGAFVDGSGWKGVYDILERDGYNVTVVQNSTASLADDVAATLRAVDAANGPVILVGHSYGGAVITEAGTNGKVAGLAYIAAFAPDKGESVASLTSKGGSSTEAPPIVPTADSHLFLDRSKFRESVAADVDADVAAFMAASQTPWGMAAFRGSVTSPAWAVRPSWYLVTDDDRMIPPPAQRAMAARIHATTVEVKGSHAVYISNPKVVAALIEKAAVGAAK